MNDHRCRENTVVAAVFATHRLEICQKCGSETLVFYAPEYLPVDVEAEIKRLRAAGRMACKGGFETRPYQPAPTNPALFHEPLPDDDPAGADHPAPLRKIKSEETDA